MSVPDERSRSATETRSAYAESPLKHPGATDETSPPSYMSGLSASSSPVTGDGLRGGGGVRGSEAGVMTATANLYAL